MKAAFISRHFNQRSLRSMFSLPFDSADVISHSACSAENLGLPGRIKATNNDDAGVTLNGTSNYAVGREDTR